MMRPQSPIEGVLFDVDGVFHVDGVAIPGAAAALGRVRQRGIPFRLLTNTTVRSRRSLGVLMRDLGFDVADDEIITAGGAAAAWVRQKHPDAAVYLLGSGDVAEEFDGIELTDGDHAGVVVIGDAAENFTYAAMNHAFRLLLNGATLVAMHRDPWWMTSSGPTIDAGAFIRGLEFASGVRSRLVGKPSAPFFRAGFQSLGLPPHVTAMVGDAIRQDLVPAMRMGATGVLVRTGKYREEDLAHGTPDVELDSVAEIERVWG